MANNHLNGPFPAQNAIWQTPHLPSLTATATSILTSTAKGSIFAVERDISSKDLSPLGSANPSSESVLSSINQDNFNESTLSADNESSLDRDTDDSLREDSSNEQIEKPTDATDHDPQPQPTDHLSPTTEVDSKPQASSEAISTRESTRACQIGHLRTTFANFNTSKREDVMSKVLKDRGQSGGRRRRCHRRRSHSRSYRGCPTILALPILPTMLRPFHKLGALTVTTRSADLDHIGDTSL